MRIAFPALGLLCLATGVYAQRSPLPPDRLARVRGVLDAMYRLNFDAAEARCRAMIAASPSDPAGRVYLARVYWQELLVKEHALTVRRFIQPDFFVEKPPAKIAADPAAVARFKQASADAIVRAQAAAERHPGDPAALFLLGAAYQNEASFLLAISRDWWQAFRAGSRSERAQRELLRMDAGYSDALLVTGLFHYTVGALPWNLRWIPFLLGYRGTKSAGVREMEEAAAKGQIVADDARALLAVLYAIDGRYDPALRELEELRAKYPENYLTELDIAGIRLRQGQTGTAIEIYRNMLKRTYAGLEKAVVYNQLGIAYRRSKNFAESEKWFRTSLADPAASPRAKREAEAELARLSH
jgi:tetratricopeptide (TPR) repeat protein